MTAPESTRWSLIRKAAQGMAPDREDFAAVYEPIARAYFLARWGGSPLAAGVDDALEALFAECFRDGGAPARAARPDGFRAVLGEALRSVARRAEGSGAAAPSDLPGLTTAFERAWAQAMAREAMVHQRERAGAEDHDARRRVMLIRKHRIEGLPILDIARLWGLAPAHLHGEYTKAEREFEAALKAVVAYHHPGVTESEIDAECRRLDETL